MQDPQPRPEDERSSERFTYFLIRIHSGGESSENLTGTMERLGSGRKQPFSGADELLGLLSDYPDVLPKIGTADERSNV